MTGFACMFYGKESWEREGANWSRRLGLVFFFSFTFFFLIKDKKIKIRYFSSPPLSPQK